MFKKIFNLKLILPVFLLLFIASCEKESYIDEDDANYDMLLRDAGTLTVEDYTADLAEMDMDEEWDVDMQGMMGKRKCFHFVFPLTLVFPDGSTQELAGPEELRAAMHSWVADHPDSSQRPVLEFPFDVEMRDGTIITIENSEQFHELKKECFQNRPHPPRFRLCFQPVFPLTVEYPNGETVEVEDFKTLRAVMRAWKINHPDVDARPHILFPIEIETSDGAIVTVASMEELRELLKECIRKLKRKHRKMHDHF